jgi:hypothetical protein
MIDILRDPVWQGIGVIIALILGIIGFYYAGKNKIWLFVAGAIVILIIGLGIGVQIRIQTTQEELEKCLIFLESNGQVAIDADRFIEQVPGRKHATEVNNPTRDATGILWQKNPDFPGAMQARPDTQLTNTRSDTNGPALVYLIDFQTKGKYYVYIKAFGAGGNSDSIHFGLGGIPATTDIEGGFSLSTDPPMPQWISRTESRDPIAIDILNPGIHTFYIWMRENGVTVQRIWLDTGIDKILSGDSSPGPLTSECKPK